MMNEPNRENYEFAYRKIVDIYKKAVLSTQILILLTLSLTVPQVYKAEVDQRSLILINLIIYIPMLLGSIVIGRLLKKSKIRASKQLFIWATMTTVLLLTIMILSIQFNPLLILTLPLSIVMTLFVFDQKKRYCLITINLISFIWVITSKAFDIYEPRQIFSISITILLSIIISSSGRKSLSMTIDEYVKRAEELKKSNIRIQDFNSQLEIKVETKTKQLNSAYKELLDKEKLKAMYNLVTGVAHQIGTPLGVSITSTSYMKSIHSQYEENVNQKKITLSKANDYNSSMGECIDILNLSLSQINSLMKNFKLFASGQNEADNKFFSLKGIIDTVLIALDKEITKNDCEVIIQCDENIEIQTNESSIYHVLNNLIHNAATHAFTNS